MSPGYLSHDKRSIKSLGGVLKSMLASDIAIIDIEEYQIKHFEVIIELLRETTGLSNGSSQSVSKATVITFNAYRMLFANSFVIWFKGGYKTVPVIHTDRAIADFQLLETSS